jgi:hypothetical protein
MHIVLGHCAQFTSQGGAPARVGSLVYDSEPERRSREQWPKLGNRPNLSCWGPESHIARQCADLLACSTPRFADLLIQLPFPFLIRLGF